MTKIKVDEGLVSTSIGRAADVSNKATSIKSALSSLKTAADESVENNKQTYIDNLYYPQDENDPDYDDDLQKWKDDCSYAESTASKYKANISDSYDDAISAVDKIISRMGSTSKALNLILSAVTQFNDNVSMKEEFEALGITISYIDNFNGGETPVIHYEIDGKTYTISELLNAFYTYTGMSMSTVVQGQLLLEEMGISEEEWQGEKGDLIRRKMLEQVNALTGFAAQTRMFGLATEADQNNFAREMNLDISQYTSATSLLSDDEKKDKYGDNLADILANALGGQRSNGAAVFAGAMGAYGLASFLNKYPNASEIGTTPAQEEKAEETQEETTSEDKSDSTDTSSPGNSSPGSSSSDSSPDYGSGGSGGSGGSSGYGGGGGGGSSSSNGSTSSGHKAKSYEKSVISEAGSNDIKPTEYEEAVKETDETIPGLVSPTIGNTEPLASPEDASILPTEELPSIPEGIEKDYDDLARKEFESQGEEAIEENRRRIIEEANQLFENDPATLREKLKEYGYSDSDIETIIQDRNLTINAMVSGDQRTKLTEIAERLAKEDGLSEFDTIYDNEQTALSLTDGTTEKLLANMSSDEGVKNAYEALTTAEANYTEANTAAVAAMAVVTTAQNKLNDLMSTIDGDIKANPSQWDSATLKAYNEEVTKLYQQKVESIGGNVKTWSSETLEKYQKEVANITNDVAYKRGTDISTWNATQKEQYENRINHLSKKYIKAYGDDVDKWSSSVKKKYEEDKIAIYKKTAVEVGKSNLTAEDKKLIATKSEKYKDKIIKENGMYSGWTAEQKEEYEKELAAIKEKYVQKVSTATGEATWTPEQAKQYNEAVEEYNKAVLAAKDAMTKLDEAKTGYADAKNNLTAAKDAFFANMNNNIPQTPIDNGVAPPVETQTNSGTQLAGGLEITEEGATIGMGGTTQLDENGVVEPSATNTTNTEVEANTAATNVPAEEIIDEDAVEQTNNNGIPIVDIAEGTIDGDSSTNSGQISNDDIMF